MGRGSANPRDSANPAHPPLPPMSHHAPVPRFLCNGRVWRIARPAANYYNGTDSQCIASAVALAAVPWSAVTPPAAVAKRARRGARPRERGQRRGSWGACGSFGGSGGRRCTEEQRGHAEKATDRHPNAQWSHVTSICAARASAPEGSGPRRRAGGGWRGSDQRRKRRGWPLSRPPRRTDRVTDTQSWAFGECFLT